MKSQRRTLRKPIEPVTPMELLCVLYSRLLIPTCHVGAPELRLSENSDTGPLTRVEVETCLSEDIWTIPMDWAGGTRGRLSKTLRGGYCTLLSAAAAKYGGVVDALVGARSAPRETVLVRWRWVFAVPPSSVFGADVPGGGALAASVYAGAARSAAHVICVEQRPHLG